MGILEMLFGGGQDQGAEPPYMPGRTRLPYGVPGGRVGMPNETGSAPQPQQGAPQPYLPGRTRMPFDIPQDGGGDNTTAFLQEYLRRQGGNNQAQPMAFRPDDPARTARPMPPMPPTVGGFDNWYQGPSDPPLEKRIEEWLKNQPKPVPPPSRPGLGNMAPGIPETLPGLPPGSVPFGPQGEEIIPGAPGRPWPQPGEPGWLEGRRRMRPDMYQGGPMPSPAPMLPPGLIPPQQPPQPPQPPTDPGWAPPREPNRPGYTGYRRPPEGQMVEGPQPLWPSKRRLA